MKALISFGSNLGDKVANCREAVRRICRSEGITVLRQSSLYQTDPVGMKDQDRFVNGMVAVETDLPPEELLNRLLAIETEMGRVRTVRWGPRIIDLDLIGYGEQVVRSETLTLPHPEAAHRRFVLVPLQEIEPEWIHPVLRKSVSHLIENLPADDQVHPIPDTL